MIDDIAVSAVAIAVFIFGIIVARFMGRMLLARGARRQDSVSDRGTIYSSDMMIRVALIGVWAGGALGSLGVLPAIAWVIDRDPDAARIAVSIFLIGGMIIGFSMLVVLLGLRFFLLESDQITRVGAFRERSIRFDAVRRLDESSGLPALRVHSEETTIRIPKTLAGFDDLFNRLTANIDTPYEAPEAATADGNAVDTVAPQVPLDQTAHYAVSSTRRRVNTITLVVTLLFVLIWPWFLVEGEHVIRDSFIFMGIGLGMWLLTVLLVRTETSPKGQPIELQLSPTEIQWRLSRGTWQTRERHELFSASVETTIIYVKGQPGHRYPLRLRFVDGDELQIDDHRGRHLGSSTQLLGLELRRRYLTVTNRSSDDQVLASEHLAVAHSAESNDDAMVAVAEYRRAIGRWPDEAHLALHRHCGDLLRAHADSLVGDGIAFRKSTGAIRSDAVGHYRAHLDAYPYDADAWQGIAACVGGGYRTDLADESIASAEQLLLSGRHTPTEDLRPVLGAS